ncbi:MAG: hypothetical protein NTY19_16480 [Planctomycetota bacterium]|nr:hypothetical protein [Planctomycetota bacterium]
MSEQSHEEPLSDSPKRLQPFLDCLAYLLAKRWLRDQRQQEETPPQDRREPHREQSESP